MGVLDVVVPPVDFTQPGHVAQRAVNYHSILRASVNVGSEAVPDEGPAINLAVAVGHVEVPLL